MIVIPKRRVGRRRRNTNVKAWISDYLRNTSVSGCANYVIPGRRAVERMFWIVVHVIAMVFAGFTIDRLTKDFRQNSDTVTTLETTHYPIHEVDYPGVAICNVNKISYVAVRSLAEEILESPYTGNFSVDDVVDMLKYMGHLYAFEVNDGEEAIIRMLHRILQKRYRPYNVKSIMRKLTPPCRTMLEYCSWSGKQRECEDLFHVRRTQDGHCCTFNYARKTDDFGSTEQEKPRLVGSGDVRRLSSVGPKFGLTVILNPEIHDYFYKVFSMIGFKILIYSPLDYPDTPSGGLREVLVAPRTESYIDLRATTLYSVPDVYGVKGRKCRSTTELKRIFGGYYSYSDCLMHCRMNDIVKECSCSPFFYPELEENTRTCDLMDLACLRKHKSKWWRVTPNDPDDMLFPFAETDDVRTLPTLNCTECIPACDDEVYKVVTSFASLTDSKLLTGSSVYNIVDHSIVHIFFGQRGAVRLKQDVLYYWYELMSDYGSVCGFFLGISLISCAELVYFGTLRVFCKRERNETIQTRLTLVRPADPSIQSLYWNEMRKELGLNIDTGRL